MPEIYAELEIELRSDLCSGSGMSNTGIIDQDVVYDDYGFPYIPAKRIKGCLREAAENIFDPGIISCMFGDRVSGKGGSVEIGNAVLKRENALLDELKACKSTDLKNFVNPEAILDMYTSVRAQTRIEEASGTAKDNNLRYTRVVNQYDPFEEGAENLCFYAPVFISETMEYDAATLEKYLAKAALALRHIGINRNRGLGSVRCSCNIVNESAQSIPARTSSISDLADNNNGTVRVIYYTIENIESMILSDRDKNDSANFISGKSILGALAGEYIRNSDYENPADTDEFADLFLNGTVKYTNLTMVIDGCRSYPAPMYLNRLKKSGEYVNALKEKPLEDASDGDGNEGNQPKKLKNEYIADSLNDEKLSYIIDEVDKEINFHYTTETETGEDQLLFSLSAIKKGQEFAGEIIICSEKSEKYAYILENLMRNARLRFGKSRSSQYGLCRLVEMSERGSSLKKFNCGDRIVVTLKSDALFLDDTGSYTVRFDKVKALLAKELADGDETLFEAPEGNDSCNEDAINDPGIMDVTEVFGYNTKWNMKRSSSPAIRAGSAFVFELKKDWECRKRFVGERTQEGFGEIGINLLSEMTYYPECKDQIEYLPERNEPVSEELKKIIAHTLRGKIVEALLLADNEKKYGLGDSQIGKLTLMLKESLNDENGRHVPPDDAAKEFGYRIQSIKTYQVREEALKYAEKTLTVIDPKDGRMVKSINAPKKKADFAVYSIDTQKIYNILEQHNEEVIAVMDSCFSKEQKENLLKDAWGEYMLQSLTLMKYRKSGSRS